MLQLYHASHSTCSQKVRMVLHEKGAAFEDIRLDLAKKDQLKPAYLALNPNGVVPTLVDDGTPIVDSSVICEYLDEKFPHNPMSPSGLLARAAMRSWMRYLEEVPTMAIRLPSFNRAFLYRFDGLDQKRFEDEQINVRTIRKEFFQRMGSAKGFSQGEIDRALDQLAETCKRMNDALEKTGPWLMGAQFTLADVLAAPSIDRMNDLGLSHLWEVRHPQIGEWYRCLQARQAFRATFYPGTRVSEFLDLRPLYSGG